LQLADPDDGAFKKENDVAGTRVAIGRVICHFGSPAYAETRVDVALEALCAIRSNYHSLVCCLLEVADNLLESVLVALTRIFGETRPAMSGVGNVGSSRTTEKIETANVRRVTEGPFASVSLGSHRLFGGRGFSTRIENACVFFEILDQSLDEERLAQFNSSVAVVKIPGSGTGYMKLITY
jgi:hypothetical protein